MDLTVKAIDAFDAGDASGPDVFEAVARDVAAYLSADMVSIWRLSGDLRSVSRFLLLKDGELRAPGDMVFNRADYPDYFNAVLESRILSAPNVRTNPHTACLYEHYFGPNGTMSMLDFILHVGKRPYAVVSCEYIGRRHDWSRADINYLRRLGSLVSHHLSARYAQDAVAP